MKTSARQPGAANVGITFRLQIEQPWTALTDPHRRYLKGLPQENEWTQGSRWIIEASDIEFQWIPK
jgi:hypothetical protein